MAKKGRRIDKRQARSMETPRGFGGSAASQGDIMSAANKKKKRSQGRTSRGGMTMGGDLTASNIRDALNLTRFERDEDPDTVQGMLAGPNQPPYHTVSTSDTGFSPQ